MVDLLLTREVTEMLRVNIRTVQRMVGRGDFPGAFKAGGHWRIPKADVEDYIERKRWERQAAASDSALEES